MPALGDLRGANVGYGSRAAVHEGKATAGHHQQAEITPTPLYAVWSGKERWYTYDGIKLLDEPAGTTGDGETVRSDLKMIRSPGFT